MTDNKPSPHQNLETLRTLILALKSKLLVENVQIELDRALRLLDITVEDITDDEEQARLAALYQVSQALGTSLDLDKVLNQVMDAVIGLTEAERGFLMLVEEDGDELFVRVGRNMEQETLQNDEMAVSRTVVRTVLASGKGVVTTNAQEDPRFSEQDSVVSLSLRSIMCAPLQTLGDTIGVIYVDSRAQIGLFTDEDLKMLNAFASQAAAAIENARVYTLTDQQLAERVEELESLARYSRALSAREDLAGVLEDTRKWALEDTRAEEVWIALCGQGEDGKKIFVGVGPNQGEEIPNTDPMLSRVLKGNTPHVFEPQGDTPAQLAVPIIGPDRTLGVIVAEAPVSFSIDDLQYLSRLANQAAVGFGKVGLSDRIEGAQMEKAKFVSIVSHELRIPMTSIMGYADLLKQGVIGELNEQQLNFVLVIRENVGRMSKLISDLSDIYKVQSGRLHVEPIALPVHGMVIRSVEAMQEDLAAKNQSVDVLVAEDLPKVFGDPNRVEQIITYLLDNASRYSPADTRIEVRAKIEGDLITTSIKDEGIGISPEDQMELFTQFFRSEQAEVREEKGWGLALSVVKNLVELMGGQVGFESQHGKGSTFWFSLPVAEG